MDNDGITSCAGDCDDNDPLVFPGQIEVCNDIDDDCDGLTDDGDPGITGQLIWYLDEDADGFGDAPYLIYSCEQPGGYVGNNLDCNDTDPAINPDAEELCNNLDDNCNGEIDERADCDENDFDQDGVVDETDNCPETFNPDQSDSDCDSVGDVCDECPGGNDAIDNNNDGRPDCAYPPSYSEITSEWKCGPKKVLVCHVNPSGTVYQQTICINFNALPAHIQHGDYLGPCGNAACAQGALQTAGGHNDPDENHLSHDHAIFLEEEETQEIEVHPNPAGDWFEVLLPWSATDFTLALFHANGKKIWEDNIKAGTESILFNRTHLNGMDHAGVYFVVVPLGQKTLITSLVLLD